MADDKDFVDGLICRMPNEKAPDFVKMNISIKRKDLGNWLRGRDDDWINIDVKESKGGKIYAEVSTWKPKQDAHNDSKSNGYQPQGASGAAGDGFDDDSIPF